VTQHPLSCAVVVAALLGLTGTAFATPTPLPSNRDVYIQVSNADGARFGSGSDDEYYINAPGGGLNQLHISTDNTPAGAAGQVTAQYINSSSTSGTFWVTTTGGRGYNDDIILLFSLSGSISDDFSLTIKSNGYQWTPSAAGVVNPVYTADAIDETFTKADFLYGPQTAKPGPGNGWTLPFYSGQDINDPTTAQYLMFIDLYVGNEASPDSIDSGDAKVEFDISGIYDQIAAFNAYAWVLYANIANDSINWTNNLSTDPMAPGQSGYSIVTTAVPVPEPSTALVFAAGLGCLSLALRSKTTNRVPAA